MSRSTNCTFTCPCGEAFTSPIYEYVNVAKARQLILEKLRTVYMDITPSQEAEMPPLRVVFGLEQLHEVINAALCPDERLGRLALSTYSRSDAERGRLFDIARK